MEAEDQIRNELSKEVLNKYPDYNRILELSSKLASFDTNNVRFTVDAGIIDRLGKELVARHETAVSELVKNAYDADASKVELLFQDTVDAHGILTIEDDGIGMTKEQLVNGFMRISSTDKIHHPISLLYHRERAGKKGIGRFATQRLGNKLTIITQTLKSDMACKVEIDWKQFRQDVNLISVASVIKEVPKVKEKGTNLVIEDLREDWSIASIKRVYRYSIDVIQPFPISKPTRDFKVDPGFLVRCFRAVGNNLEEVADADTMIFDHALAEITGCVNNTREGSWKIVSKKLGIDESGVIGKEDENTEDESSKNSKFNFVQNVNFKAYYFIYRAGMLPKLVLGSIREKAKENGGFRLYRNGFRVLPYGEPQNDWLGLDESVRRRVVLPPHGNNNFFGFIEINDPKGEVFNELSSREGLFKDSAFDELVNFVYRSILTAVGKIAEKRQKKQTSGQKREPKESKDAPEEPNDIADELDKIADELDNDSSEKNESENNNEDDSSNEASDNDNADFNRSERMRLLAEKIRQTGETLEEISMLRVLAGLGLTIGEFTHEIKQFLPAFAVDADFLVNNLEKNTELFKRAYRLKESFISFSTYASYFDNTISQNVQREIRPIELRDVVNSFLNVIGPDLERNSFEMQAKYDGYDLFTCKMHPSEWASILFNLYSNSKKAIKRAKIEGRISIKAGIIENSVYLDFYDNGDGVPEENAEKIFNAFFTTSNAKGHSATTEEELTGTGLGLTIVKDIVESYGGEIYLSTHDEEFAT